MGMKQMKMTQSLHTPHRGPYTPHRGPYRPATRNCKFRRIGSGLFESNLPRRCVQSQADNGNGHCQHTGRLPFVVYTAEGPPSGSSIELGYCHTEADDSGHHELQIHCRSSKDSRMSAVLPQNANSIFTDRQLKGYSWIWWLKSCSSGATESTKTGNGFGVFPRHRDQHLANLR